MLNWRFCLPWKIRVTKTHMSTQTHTHSHTLSLIFLSRVHLAYIFRTELMSLPTYRMLKILFPNSVWLIWFEGTMLIHSHKSNFILIITESMNVLIIRRHIYSINVVAFKWQCFWYARLKLTIRQKRLEILLPIVLWFKHIILRPNIRRFIITKCGGKFSLLAVAATDNFQHWNSTNL